MNRLTRLTANVCSLSVMALLCLPSMAATAETAAIHLQDGSTIRGEVVSLKGGSYQVQTQTLGVLTISQNNVRVVEYGAPNAALNNTQPAAPAPAPGANSAQSSQMAAITSRLQNSPALLGDIQALSNDPAIMAIVKDPEIQRLISSGDYASLMSNPKMRRLMSNSKIRNITGQLK